MKIIKRTILTLAIFVVACENFLIGDDPVNTPENNFEMLWQEFDRWYALFLVKNIDWDELYAIYRPQVTPETTDDALWDIITAMLEHLDDGHVTLEDPRRNRFFASGDSLNKQALKEFDLQLVKEKYLHNRFRVAGDGRMLYGNLNDGTGYLHIMDFEGDFPHSPEPWAEDIDPIISQFKDVEGMIVDIRNNGGGGDGNAHRIAGAFADQRRFVYTVQTRNGPKHSDFDAPRKWYVQPSGKTQFTGPVVLLTDRWSASAAEIFSLLMVSLPHVTHIGDTTAGDFSDISFGRFLPNGWTYKMPIQLYLLPDGRSLEGIGTAPEFLIKNTEADIAAGNDKALEFAMVYLSQRVYASN